MPGGFPKFGLESLRSPLLKVATHGESSHFGLCLNPFDDGSEIPLTHPTRSLPRRSFTLTDMPLIGTDFCCFFR